MVEEYRVTRRSAVWLALIALTAGLLVPDHGQAESPDDLLIIANKNVPVKSVSASELRRIFLKKQTSWEGAKKVVPINAKKGSALRTYFQRAVMGMTQAEEDRHWQDEKIRRGEKAPAELSDTLKAVFMVKGSVSYLFRKQYKPNLVRVLATF